MPRWPIVLVCLVGCFSPPAQPVGPRPPVAINASPERIWAAVSDEFVAENIPVRTSDRAGGIVASGEIKVATTAKELADCGSTLGLPIAPLTAEYRVVVRGSSVQASTRWASRMAAGSSPCESRGVWESAFESAVKRRAEQ